MPDAPKKVLIGPISPAAAGALYEQIIDGFKREISAGRLAPGAPLPSFRQLAEDLMVSLITVKRAYEEMEREGIVFRRQGLGTFVAEKGADRSREVKLEAALDHFRQGIEEATQSGLATDEIIDLVKKELRQRKGARR